MTTLTLTEKSHGQQIRAARRIPLQSTFCELMAHRTDEELLRQERAAHLEKLMVSEASGGTRITVQSDSKEGNERMRKFYFLAGLNIPVLFGFNCNGLGRQRRVVRNSRRHGQPTTCSPSRRVRSINICS
jgi:hypothetical protein